MSKEKIKQTVEDLLDELYREARKSKKAPEKLTEAMRTAPSWYIDLMHLYAGLMKDPDMMPTTCAAIFELVTQQLYLGMLDIDSPSDVIKINDHWPRHYVMLLQTLWEVVEDAIEHKAPLLEIASLLQFITFKLNKAALDQINELAAKDLAQMQRKQMEDKELN